MKFYPTLDETLAKRFEPSTQDGLDEIRDISNHGIDAGFSGFIYYHETIAFFNEFQYEIEERLDDMGYTMIDLVDDNEVNFTSARNKAVWIVVESWCHHVVDTIDDTVDQERDMALIAQCDSQQVAHTP